MTKHYLSGNEYLHDMWSLADKVLKSGWRPDLLIALWRGGAPVGVSVHEYLKVAGWSIKHLPLKCASYTGIGCNEGEVLFTLGEEIFGMLQPNDKVLIVDDVFDTGKTASAVKARIDRIGAQMKMACVYWKPSRNKTELVPDYFVRDVGDDWLVFPHEIDGLTAAEIKEKDAFLADLFRHQDANLA